MVVLEVNPNVPFAHGQCHVHISQVTALVESADPIMEVGLPTIGAVQEAIGKHVAGMIEDGSTLQIGYGGIPDAVVMQLTHKQDLGIHTELMTPGLAKLIECGAVTNRLKTTYPGRSVFTFAMGDRAFYDFLDDNPSMHSAPVQVVNDPQRVFVVPEGPVVRRESLIQRGLPGVTEGRVAEVVAEGDGFGQVLVQAECARDGPGDLHDLQRVRHPAGSLEAGPRGQGRQVRQQKDDGHPETEANQDAGAQGT